MAGLNPLVAAKTLGSRFAWDSRRVGRQILRRFGAVGLVLGTCAVCAGLAWSARMSLTRELADWRTLSSAAAQKSTNLPLRVGDSDSTGIASFLGQLLSHDDIPVVIQDLIDLADQQQLLLVRGDYKAQPDSAGGFLRYRMALPVKGEMPAIQAFMAAALRAQPSLAVEAVQFKRERIASQVVEARIQWVLMTRMPGGASTRPAGIPP